MGDALPRTGIGLDLHGSAPGRPLMLGGVEVSDHGGLDGHSDGDVVCHAIADALLGALALGDVGSHFPDTDPDVEGIAGVEIVARTMDLLAARGHRAASVDVTVIAERPAIAPLRDRMRAALAEALGLDITFVSVKATRPEGLGLGGEGIGCLAVAVVV